VALTGAVLVGVLLLLAQTTPGHAALRATGLSRQRVPFTELYFFDPGGLDATLPASHHLELRFVLHSDAGSSRAYTWTATEKRGDALVALGSGHLLVPSGASILVTRNVDVACRRGRTELNVSLAATPIHIDRWLDCPPRR
jgi:hypothetical protein